MITVLPLHGKKFLRKGLYQWTSSLISLIDLRLLPITLIGGGFHVVLGILVFGGKMAKELPNQDFFGWVFDVVSIIIS